MEFLKWLGGIVILVWLISFLFSVGGNLIHLLLVIAAIVFIIDVVFGKRNKNK